MSNDIENMVSRLRKIGYVVTAPEKDLSGVSNLPARLKALRQKNRYTLQFVADKFGTSRGYIWKLEQKKDDHNMSAAFLMGFADLYDLDPSDLYYGKAQS